MAPNIPPRFTPTAEELKRIAQRQQYKLQPKSIRTATDQWLELTLVKAKGEGNYTLYPHLRGFLTLFKEDPSYSQPDGTRHCDFLTYHLQEDLYANSLWYPSSTGKRLSGFIDWLYFPKVVRGKIGHHFQYLQELWETMCLNGDRELYRRSLDVYGHYSPFWSDGVLRYEIGTKLIRMAIFYGDNLEALCIANSLKTTIASISDEKQRHSSSDMLDVLTLELNSYVRPNHFPTHIAEYERMFERAKLGLIAATRPQDTTQQFEILSAVWRSACNYSVFHIIKCLSVDTWPNGEALSRFLRLVDDFIKLCDGSKLGTWTSQDINIYAKAWIVAGTVSAEIKGVDRKAILESGDDLIVEATRRGVVMRQREHKLVDRVLKEPALGEYVSGIDKKDVWIGLQVDCWSILVQAMWHIASGRWSTFGHIRLDYFNAARKELRNLDSMVSPNGMAYYTIHAGLLDNIAVLGSKPITDRQRNQE